ncbi:MAG: hypothetical protein ABW047_12890 [Nitrospiraceae bacterium]
MTPTAFNAPDSYEFIPHHLVVKAGKPVELTVRSVTWVVPQVGPQYARGGWTLEVISILQQDCPATKMVVVDSGEDPLQRRPLPDTVEVLSKPVEDSQLRATVHHVLARQ